jgi:hypothetical protein
MVGDMVTQRITIAKVGGKAAEVVMLRLQEWSASRRTTDPDEWSSEQWRPEVRRLADSFADGLRAHALVLPVVHFIEWADLWSMGDLYHRWLTPPDGPRPSIIHADRFEIYGYALPDGGRLGDHLSSAGPQQWDESDWFVSKLSEAVGAWQHVVDQAALIVLREVVGGLTTDEELAASLDHVPDWISEIRANER